MAKTNDLGAYTNLLQKTYQDVYPYEPIGLKKEYFSQEIFRGEDIQRYLRSNLALSSTLKTWLAFFNQELVGSITIEDQGKECELRGFYVKTEHQGKGIGKKLWEKARKFAKKKDIFLDTYTHNKKTISIYKKWGFVIDEKRGRFLRHWPQWPQNVSVECLYMRFK